MDELIAENQAYDETIKMLNERRSLCEMAKRGTDTAQGRHALAEMMKKSNAPFALISEPATNLPPPQHAKQTSAFLAKHKSVTHSQFEPPV